MRGRAVHRPPCGRGIPAATGVVAALARRGFLFRHESTRVATSKAVGRRGVPMGLRKDYGCGPVTGRGGRRGHPPLSSPPRRGSIWRGWQPWLPREIVFRPRELRSTAVRGQRPAHNRDYGCGAVSAGWRTRPTGLNRTAGTPSLPKLGAGRGRGWCWRRGNRGRSSSAFFRWMMAWSGWPASQSAQPRLLRALALLGCISTIFRN